LGWLKMLFSLNREMQIRVRVRADEVAMDKWFSNKVDPKS